MVKVPQIKRIAAKKSARGLRLQMFATEILAGTIGIAYCASNGVALAAYAELYFILVQNLIILALIGVYGDGDGDDARRDAPAAAEADEDDETTKDEKEARRREREDDRASAKIARAPFFFLSYVGLLACLRNRAILPEHLALLYNCTTALLFLGRAPQIAQNARTRSTGELSVSSQVAMTFGGFARVLTTIQEKGGASMIGAYALSFGTQATMLAQMVMYREKKKKTE